MVDQPPHSAARPWACGRDLLVLFTDGISDARNRADLRLGEEPVLETVRANRDRPVAEIVERVFATLAAHTGDVPPRDDLTLVITRS
jgi:sigma-B regulation protein RsbU (phosphoserine phosphatase)